MGGGGAHRRPASTKSALLNWVINARDAMEEPVVSPSKPPMQSSIKPMLMPCARRSDGREEIWSREKLNLSPKRSE